MRSIFLLGLFIALTRGLPVAEESWHAEDDLLARIYKDSSPMSVLLQSPSAAEASAAKADEDAAAAKAADMEAKFAGEEQTYANEAKKLNEEERAQAKKAQEDNAAAAAQLKKDSAAAMAKIAQANKDSAEAAAHAQLVNASYYAVIEQMKNEGKKAHAKSEADAKKLKEKLDSLQKQSEDEKNVGKEIQARMAREAAALIKKKEDIEAAFEAKTKELQAEDKKNQDHLAAEMKNMSAHFAAQFKSNAEQAAAAMAAIAAEKEQEDKIAAEKKAEIESRYADLESAQKLAEDAYQQQQKDKARVLAETRAAKKEKVQKKAAADEEAYQRAAAKAAEMKTAADHAHQEWQAAMDASVENQKKMDEAAAAQREKDANLHSCADDGSQCRNGTECLDLDDEKGPYLSDDLVTCTDTKPEDQEYAGESWAGVPPPAGLEPLPKPSPMCIVKRKVLEDGPYGWALTQEETCPMQAIACHNTTDFAAKKKAYLDFFAMAEVCPPYCLPDTATHTDDMVQDTHGICIDPDDVAGFKMQIEDLPVYKNMGTDGKIPAGPPADLCRMARMFLEGIGAATATPAPTAAPEPATPAPAPFSDESQDPDAYRHYDLPNTTNATLA